jgi:hypothetical protein
MRQRILLAWSALLLPTAWLLGPALVTDRFFVFRDVAHFYLPLWHWMRGEWASGRVPLWNPYDGFGVPLVADGTSAVFYPVWWFCFALPFSLALCAKLYLMSHVLLAAIGAYRVVRRWQGSPEAAALAGIAYAYGGSVLFQVCNPPFLIGAAWLPWAVLFAERLLRRKDVRAAIGLAVVLSLMVLGGDPQMALHLALFTAGGFIFYGDGVKAFWNRWRSGQWRTLIMSRPALLFLACGFAGCLAAVQVLPSMERTRMSTRADFESPRSIYEIPEFLRRPPDEPNVSHFAGIRQGLFGETPPYEQDHAYRLYQFSQGPWRWIELVWPNISGRMFPTHRRWMDALPAEGVVWTPSLYMGLIPFLLAVTQLRLSRGSPRNRWLSWTVVFFAAGSLGWYGVGWLMREMYAAVPGMNSDDVWLGQPVGGVYWFLVTFVPGYVYFRYPAKLWVVTALMLSLLAARVWDLLPAKLPKVWRRCLVVFAAASLLAAGCLAYLGDGLWELAQVPNDKWFGPFDPGGATTDVLFGLIQVGILGLTVACLALAPQKLWRSAVIVTSVEICLANVWLLPTAPIDLWKLPPTRADEIRVSDTASHELPESPDLVDGFYSPGGNPFMSSDQRLEEILANRRERLFSHFRMLDPAGSFVRPGAESSLESAAERALHFSLIDIWPRIALRPDIRAIEALPADISWQERRKSLQVFDYENVPSPWLDNPLSSNEHVPVLEIPPNIKLTSRKKRHLRVHQITYLRETSQQFTIGLECASPRFLILRDSYDPDWSAEVQSDDEPSRPLPIFRADGVFRAVDLPAGKHVVTFTYRPQRVWLGGIVSALAWVGLTAFCLRFKTSRQQRRQDSGQHNAVERAGPANRDEANRRPLEPPQVE